MEILLCLFCADWGWLKKAPRRLSYRLTDSFMSLLPFHVLRAK